jgi:hypothetical protein
MPFNPTNLPRLKLCLSKAQTPENSDTERNVSNKGGQIIAPTVPCNNLNSYPLS